jgi:hypothetical protein
LTLCVPALLLLVVVVVLLLLLQMFQPAVWTWCSVLALRAPLAH